MDADARLMGSRFALSPRWTKALLYGAPALLFAVVLLTFSGVLGHDFVAWDDEANILNNEHVRGVTRESLLWMFTDTTYAPRYMPLGWLCYAVDRQLFGLDPRPWHAGNLLFHATNALLLFFLLRKLVAMAGAPERNRNVPTVVATACAFLGALFWAVNPLRVEVVSWASCRIYGVAFFFVMLWLLFWLRSRDAEPGRMRSAWSWLSLGAFAASLLTYPLAVFGPVFLFLLDVYPLRRFPAEPKAWSWRAIKPLCSEKIPFLIVSAAILAAAAFARMGAGGSMQPTSVAQFGLFERGMQAAYVLAYYAWKPLGPLFLAPSYPTLHAFSGIEWRFLASASAVVALGILALVRLRQSWLPATLFFSHVIFLVPVLGISEYPHSAYDRYSHLHSILWSGVLALGLAALWRRHGRCPRLSVLVAAAMCAAFIPLCLGQIPVWKDTFALSSHIVRRYGDHPSRARFDEVVAEAHFRAGRTNEAIASLERAARFDLLRKDRNIYNEGVATRVEKRLGDIALKRGDIEEAAMRYVAAVNAESVSYYAVPITIRAADLLIQLGRGDEALPLLRNALRTAPKNARLHQQLGTVLQHLGKEAEAQQHFEEELRLRAAANQRQSQS